MWELDHKEGWAPKNWCFWTVGLGNTPESPLDCKKIKQINLKRNQSWILIGRTDADAETVAPQLWPPDTNNWLIRKDPDSGKDCRCEEKGMTEHEMVGWHHWLNEHVFEQASGRWWWTGSPGMLQSMGLQSWTWLCGWTTQQERSETVVLAIIEPRVDRIWHETWVNKEFTELAL